VGSVHELALPFYSLRFEVLNYGGVAVEPVVSPCLRVAVACLSKKGILKFIFSSQFPIKYVNLCVEKRIS
jgi:hypothetical protein